MDLDTGHLKTIHTGAGLYYGITAAPDGRVFVVARNRMVSSSTSSEEERGSLLEFDPNLDLLARHQSPFPLRDLHGITWHQDKLWMTCSRDNFIAIRAGDRWGKWFPLAEDHSSDRDVHHYNTIEVFDDKICLVAHNHGDSELMFFDHPHQAPIQRISLGRIAHNVWRENGDFFTCSSGDGKILSTAGFELEIGGFVRGHTRIPGGMHLIGVNEYCERGARDSTTSKLILFSSDWQQIRSFSLPDLGMLLDIMVVSD
jgi:hypothetical protein